MGLSFGTILSAGLGSKRFGSCSRIHTGLTAPEQYLAVGWVNERLYSVIFEFREDTVKPISAEAIARLAGQGKDISGFFEQKGRMIKPIQRVKLDATAKTLDELDQAAIDLNISRQAVIKALVRQGLDQHYVAQRARRQ
jgi:hypothetical protein